MDKLKAVLEQLENVTDKSELLWTMMQLDIEKLKNRVDNAEELAGAAKDCDKRMVGLVAHEYINFSNSTFLVFSA